MFDNAADPDRAASVLARYRRHPGRGHHHRPGVRRVRQAGGRVCVHPAAVGGLPGGADRAGRRDGADAVAQELGDLPLGLAQAAATIARQRLTYGQYLQRLREVPVRELLGRSPGEDYPHATAAALLLSVQATEASDPTGLAGGCSGSWRRCPRTGSPAPF